jgi:hypothetical protein
MSAAGEREEGGGDAGGLVGPSRRKGRGRGEKGGFLFFISNSCSKVFAI